MNLLVLIGLIRDLIAAVKAKDWPLAFTVLGKLFEAISQFIGGVTGVSVASGDEAALDAAMADLKACCEPATLAADPKALPPGTILLIVELIGAVFDWWKKRRQG